MLHSSRRAFLGASVAGLFAGSAFGVDEPAIPASKFNPAEITFNPSTLFLTWQSDPTTTMTIQWIGTRGETPDTNIYYAPAATSDWWWAWNKKAPILKPYGQTDFKVYRAELTGLHPGKDYLFRIGKSSPVWRFRTMPAKSTNEISFISGGDCGVNPHTVANNIQAARQDPSFAVIGGDLAYENGRSADTHLTFLKNYSRTMIAKDGRLIPMLACLGNHEVDGGYNKPREKAPFFYALFDGLFDDTSYATLDFGEYLSLVLLDTGHNSPIEGEQTHWLEDVLKHRESHPNVFVVGHVPAYPSFRKATAEKGKEGTGTGEANRKHWVPLFEKYRVPVVLEHHDHTFKRTKPLVDGLGDDNGVLYLGDGSWGRQRAPQKPEKLSYLAASSAAYHLSLHRIQGEQRYHLALDEDGRVMDVSHTAQRKKGIAKLSD
ncbi:purple acid phosphatase family protein [Zavarzinella formosa]|uniref:purple acid phosphatase family protein n=1 Tax=Zavarzinella formosa TaxID=360055 RepID=UPI0002DE1E3E|nr:metallophosphoesterase family protein [Zavarzinella formosa]